MAEIVMHPEAVKAAIRMRCGSIETFARARDLKSQVVRDLLRGHSNTAKAAVAQLLGVEADQLVISRSSTLVASYSSSTNTLHRQSAEAN